MNRELIGIHLIRSEKNCQENLCIVTGISLEVHHCDCGNYDGIYNI